ncbi:uncharacterized protein LOC122374812 [Amphibalanus amphitrite]|uniref:uncharacterized protein LOC122374812 n=1 Tax=Amphibalanus amphitrite TaxID=1232801 RepID=UPI001C8FD0EA|nr:uncharacterized protein LOC122374812 [Amphibalanus amphitrite]
MITTKSGNKVGSMSDSRPASVIPSIALNVPPPPDRTGGENGAKGPPARRTMGSPEEPEEAYYRLPPKDVRCPVCRVGALRTRFTACGVFLAVVLFPLGLIPCFLLREKRCNHCTHRAAPGDQSWSE